MPRDSITGVATLVHDWVADEAASIPIAAATQQEQVADIADMITGTAVRDGSLPMTNNLDMGSFRVTRVANAAEATDALPAGQADARYLRANVSGAIGLVNDSSVAGAKVKDALETLLAAVTTAQATAAAAAPSEHEHDSRYFRNEQVTALLNGYIARAILTNPGELVVRSSVGPTHLAAPTGPGQLLRSDLTRPTRMIWSDAPTYVLPVASSTVLGGVKVEAGSGLAIDVDGSLSVASTSGTIRNILGTSYTANANITTVIPSDDTTPLSTEGTEIISLAITPQSASSRFRLRFSGFGYTAGGAGWVATIWKAGDTSPLISGITLHATSQVIEVLISPATASPMTFTVRVGPAAADTLRLNGTAAARYFGGTASAHLSIEEIA